MPSQKLPNETVNCKFTVCSKFLRGLLIKFMSLY